MPQVVIASQNPVKIQATQNAFQAMFPNQKCIFNGISTPSNVADQPVSNKETLQGATNRTNNAANTKPNADFYVGIEGGVAQTPHGMEIFTWVVVKSNNKYSQSKSGTFTLPSQIVQLIKEGKELGEARYSSLSS